MFPNLTEHPSSAPVLSAEISSNAGPSEPRSSGEDEPRSAAGRETDACLVSIGARARGMDIAGLALLSEEHVSEMELLVGPVLERKGGYSYDTFTLADGLRSSFRYRRVEEARYDQRALIAESERDSRCHVRMCEIVSEFNSAIEAVRNGNGSLPQRGEER